MIRFLPVTIVSCCPILLPLPASLLAMNLAGKVRCNMGAKYIWPGAIANFTELTIRFLANLAAPPPLNGYANGSQGDQSFARKAQQEPEGELEETETAPAEAGPNVLGGNSKALFKWASSRTSHNLLIVSRCDSDRSKSTRWIARNANVVSASLLRSKADRIEGEPMSSRNRKTVAASVRLCFGGKCWHNKTCATLRASTINRSERMRKQRGKCSRA
jgi:hypothetical protein